MTARGIPDGDEALWHQRWQATGSTLLADDELRHGFAGRIGADERT